MPDSDEYQRLNNENSKYSLSQQQYLKTMNNLIPDIWAEIGKNMRLFPPTFKISFI
jgi:hypothetical protein